MAEPYRGVFPIAPVPFHEDESLDLDGMRRVLDCMIDQGVEGICILANFSEQFLISDAEREMLTRLCMEHVDGRVPVIDESECVGCNLCVSVCPVDSCITMQHVPDDNPSLDWTRHPNNPMRKA